MTSKPVPKPKHKRRKPKISKRNEFTKKARELIYNRDGGLCQLCATKGTEYHHIKFRSKGGRGVYTNGALLCHSCHTKVHQKYELAELLRERAIMRYGETYYMDQWDKEI